MSVSTQPKSSAPPVRTAHAQHSDVLILGAGVMGLSCALQLLKAGRSVTLLDKGKAGAATSAGNCGTITPSHAQPLTAPGTVSQALRWMLQNDAPLRIKPTLNLERLSWFWHFARRCRDDIQEATTRARAAIALQSRDLLAQLITDEGFDCEFVPQGTLHVWRNQQEFEHAQQDCELLNALGLPVEIKDAQQVHALEPALNDQVIGGLYHTRDAQLRPERYMAELSRRVIELGGRIIEEQLIDRIEHQQDRIQAVHCGQQIYRANEYIMALGAWTPKLAKQLALSIPIQPGKGYSMTYDRPQYCPKIPMVLEERSVCVTAWGSGFRLGSTMEFSGYDESMNRQRLNALERAAREYLQDPHGPNKEQEWYGWRPMTWDDLPIIGRAPEQQNLTLATGHGMLGITMSAATSLLVKQIICAEQPALDPHPYRPSRFTEKQYR